MTAPPTPSATPAPRGRLWGVVVRVANGVWHDGFIHAGNLAYMTILALFPFIILAGALFSLVGEQQVREASVHALFAAMPRQVAKALEPVGLQVMGARQLADGGRGSLLWLGGAVGLWTVSSLVETLREVLRRAYGVARKTNTFLRYRLLSSGLVTLAVVLLLVALYAQVAINTALEVVLTSFPRFHGLVMGLRLSRLLPMPVLFGALYLLFYALTPSSFRLARYPKWPGVLLVCVWWALVSVLLPMGIGVLFKYDLTYGSLAGVMVSLFFFWLVGLGMVTGAQLNAALAARRDEGAACGGPAIGAGSDRI